MKYIVACAALFFVACSTNDPYKRMEKFSGLWKMDTDEGPLYEEWSRPASNTMYGKTYVLNGTDSLVFERVQLVNTDSGIYYIPVVKDQNEGKPVSFKLINSDDSLFVFENKLHDFPQRVIYRFVHKDSIAARIEGKEKGVPKSASFNYSRIK